MIKFLQDNGFKPEWLTPFQTAKYSPPQKFAVERIRTKRLGVSRVRRCAWNFSLLSPVKIQTHTYVFNTALLVEYLSHTLWTFQRIDILVTQQFREDLPYT